jgi:hypothetical protein
MEIFGIRIAKTKTIRAEIEAEKMAIMQSNLTEMARMIESFKAADKRLDMMMSNLLERGAKLTLIERALPDMSSGAREQIMKLLNIAK